MTRTWLSTPKCVARATRSILDYRLEKTPGEGAGWPIYDLNVMGIWLIENYRTQFTKEISAGGIDGLIASLAERNKANASPAAASAARKS